MVKPLFKEKTSKFGSIISVAAIFCLTVIFFMGVPDFLRTMPGRILAIVWSLVAILSLLAHSGRLKGKQQRYPLYLPAKTSVKYIKREKGGHLFSRG